MNPEKKILVGKNVQFLNKPIQSVLEHLHKALPLLKQINLVDKSAVVSEI